VNIFELVVVQPIFNLLMGLYALVPGRDFGVAIIIFTIIVRFALYPLTRSMLHQSKAMRKLQPELARIKKQTKGNKQAESVAMMELYKKHGVSPFRSIGIRCQYSSRSSRSFKYLPCTATASSSLRMAL
jgi:YidC/Oxa1 family membrane protein insertase